MPDINGIHIELIGIGRALLNKMLTVPCYQRSYAWEEEHIKDYLSDIGNAVQRGDKEYFLGSIVTTKNNSPKPEIADGQQRLATTVILLAAIRDHFFNNNDLQRASNVSIQYLNTQDLETMDITPKLRLNDDDNDFFVKRILNNPDSQERAVMPTKVSHRRIVRAAELTKANVAQINGMNNPTKRLADLVEYIKDCVKVIWVSVTDDANAFTIFETLNDRGLDLALSDLLKNYLFGKSGDRITEVQQRWVQMIGMLESIEEDESVVTYIRQLWSSKNGLTREKELYDEIKDEIRNKAKALEFATELSENAKLYIAILNPAHELWHSYGPTAREHIATLKLLKITQLRPLIMAVLRKFTVPDTQKIIKLMVSWSVRFLITGGTGGGVLEVNYSKRAKEISDGTITTATQLIAKMKDIVPTDTQFKDAFSTALVSTSYLARYYLRVLEKQERGELNPEFIPIDNTDVVNLEHILPQSPSVAWSHFTDEDKISYAKRIGNLALLQTPINSSAGNDSFAFKKTFYRQSEYKLTNHLAQLTEWKVESINARQKKLAELAIKAWPLD